MEGSTAEEILDQVPDLDLARIYAALAYYYANKAEIDADIAADQAVRDSRCRSHARPPRVPVELAGLS
jgi:hypothetical protein